MRSINIILLLLCFQFLKAQTLSETQIRNARATGYAIIAAKNPGISFSVLVIPWDGVNTLEYNANVQINPGWHAQAAIKGNFFYQAFDGSDFSTYSSVITSQDEFDLYKSTGTQWWIVCSTLPTFSSTIHSKDAKIGIATTNPLWTLDVRGTIAAMNAGGDGALGTALLFGHAGYPLTQNHRIRASTSASAPLNILQIETSNGTVGQYNESQLVLKGNGSVGIGTSSPSQRLDVFGYIRSINGFVGDNGLKLWADNSSTIPGLFLSPNGNIGLGSVNPTEKLSIYGVNNSLPAIISLESSREDAQGAEVGTLKVKNSTVDIAGISVGRASGSYTGYMRFLVKPENNLPLIEAFRIKENGNIGIGTTMPMEKLSVNGNVRAKKLIVTQTGWPDYVFAPQYELKPLSVVESFIKKYKHLPDMPSEKEVAEQGLDVGQTEALLLKKIEEFSLYLIALNKKIEKQEKQIQLLQREIVRAKKKRS